MPKEKRPAAKCSSMDLIKAALEVTATARNFQRAKAEGRNGDRRVEGEHRGD